MRFGILGGLDVADEDGRELELGGRKQRSVLAILLLHANEVVSRDRLMEELWSGQPPASAATSLHAHISRLRRALGEDRRIVTTGGGYLIRVADGELDRDRFERMVEEGGTAISAGDWQLASGRLREALSLWRGPPLSDFRYDSFAQAEAARLEELHIGAVEQRIEAELALGRDTQVVGDLERLVREHPYRERLHGQLMLALYRTGRQADALAAYQAARGTLVDELGIEPSGELRELEQRILQRDPSLSPLVAPAPAAGLPVPATPFLGRSRELAEVIALLGDADRRLLTLTGAGGSGKTRLAVRAAQACAEGYPGGVWFVGFADVTDPGLIAPAICQALGLIEQPEFTPAQRLGADLRDRELLLLLDNLEQLTRGAGVLGELLAGCPGLRMLVTSREPLHLAAEQQYEVPALDRQDAIELFVARARAIASPLNIDRALADAICERLDRLPLAIELAAARTKALSPAEILARLERRTPVLAAGPRDAPQRQRTLQATIDWSYELLSKKEQQLFTQLAVFAGGCTLEAAEAVCDGEVETLGTLVDRSLLRTDGDRYWMLQTLREYALEKLERCVEEEQLRRRHAQWFVQLLHEHRVAELSIDVGPDTIWRRLGAERENFRAALEWAKHTEDFETSARLAVPLCRLWSEEGRLSDAERWLAVVRERLNEYALPVRAGILSTASQVAQDRGDYEQAAELAERSLMIYRQLGEAEGIFWAILSQAALLDLLGDLTRSRARFEEALQFAREHATEHVPDALANLADVDIAEGRLDQARARCEEALALTPDTDTRPVIGALLNLAHVANLERRRQAAAELAQQAFARSLRAGYRAVAATASLELAWSLAERVDPRSAARLLGAALEAVRQTGVAMQRTDKECDDAVRDTLRERGLDAPTLRRFVDEGRSMNQDQAVREALKSIDTAHEPR
jgi:predicted ATPase/DNA-binding SARP family transcriptional activator